MKFAGQRLRATVFAVATAQCALAFAAQPQDSSSTEGRELILRSQLVTGSNQIEFSNANNYAPNLDSIMIGPVIGQTNQAAAIIGQARGNK